MHEIQKAEMRLRIPGGLRPHRLRRLSGLGELASALQGKVAPVLRRCKTVLAEESGQGTTEYAILVGVLVVIAILAIIAFRDKVGELWDAIASGINDL